MTGRPSARLAPTPQLRLTGDVTWREDAACRNHPWPDDFFSDGQKATHRITRRAVAVCEECPVRTQCLQEALAAGPEQWGIWGGFSARERKKLMRQGMKP